MFSCSLVSLFLLFFSCVFVLLFVICFCLHFRSHSHLHPRSCTHVVTLTRWKYFLLVFLFFVCFLARLFFFCFAFFGLCICSLFAFFLCLHFHSHSDLHSTLFCFFVCLHFHSHSHLPSHPCTHVVTLKRWGYFCFLLSLLLFVLCVCFCRLCASVYAGFMRVYMQSLCVCIQAL